MSSETVLSKFGTLLQDSGMAQVRPVTGLSVEVKPSLVVASWTRPDQVASFTPRLKYRIKGDQEWTTVTLGRDSCQWSTRDLVPACEYEVLVQTLSLSRGVRQVQCDPVSFWTSEATPSAPCNLHCTGVAGTTISLCWDPPRQPNGAIALYRIYYRDVDQPQQVQHTETASCTHEVAHLFESKVYELQVCAVTSAGEGPPSHVLRQGTRVPRIQQFLTSNQELVSQIVYGDLRTNTIQGLSQQLKRVKSMEMLPRTDCWAYCVYAFS
eukprot:m.73447 g.73447  ORF g.73447 m.73447 type:complete len:267 (-) comp12368_c0_seq1:748-1548(-)